MTMLKDLLFTSFLVSAFFTSCNGQTAPIPRNEALSQEPSFTGKNIKLTKTLGSDEYQHVGCSLRDKAGNIWFGTTAEGVYRYDGKVFTQFTKKDGLCGNGIFFIAGDAPDDIWFGTKEAISHFDGKRFTNISIPGLTGSNFLKNSLINNSPPK